MKLSILLLSWLLFFLEWYVIRYTRIKFYVPIVITFVIGIPIGLLYGLHLVVYPMSLVVLAWLSCLLEDALRAYLNRKRMTEEERSRLKDL